MTRNPFKEADYSDQTGFFDPKSMPDTLTLIGLGGIGATLLPVLVTMGIRRFVLWDFDVVEPRNIASQLLYKPDDLYRPKAVVCREYLLAYGAKEVVIKQERFTAQSNLDPGVVICGVDSMAARHEIWQALQAHADTVSLYMDGRIGGENAILLALEPWDARQAERYAKSLHGDDEAQPLPCTQRAIVYPAVALAAFMANTIRVWASGSPIKSRTDMAFGKNPMIIVH